MHLTKSPEGFVRFETAAGSVEVEAVGGANAALQAIDYLDALR